MGVKILNILQKQILQDRSHQWSTRPAHIPGRQWLSLDFEVLGRTDGRTDTLCENSDHYRPGLWSASWINYVKQNLSSVWQKNNKKEKYLAIHLDQFLLL